MQNATPMRKALTMKSIQLITVTIMLVAITTAATALATRGHSELSTSLEPAQPVVQLIPNADVEGERFSEGLIEDVKVADTIQTPGFDELFDELETAMRASEQGSRSRRNSVLPTLDRARGLVADGRTGEGLTELRTLRYSLASADHTDVLDRAIDVLASQVDRDGTSSFFGIEVN